MIWIALTEDAVMADVIVLSFYLLPDYFLLLDSSLFYCLVLELFHQMLYRVWLCMWQ